VVDVEILSHAAALVWLRDQPWPIKETSTDEKRALLVERLVRIRGLVECGVVSDAI
jgi:hypothetical protein